MCNYPVVAEGYGVFVTPQGGQILECEEVEGVKRFLKHCKTLNVQAGAILEQCTGCNTVADIVDILEKKFEDVPPDISTQVQTFLDEVFQEGYILYSDTPEKRGMIKGSIDYFIPTSILFEITTNCNLRCEHCLLAAGEPLEDELPASEIISALERLFELGASTLDISGGELLTKKGWEKITGFCKNKFTLSILTNGTLVTKEIADKLADYDRVSISLYGADAETHDNVTGVKGSFEQVVGGAALLTERGIGVRAAILMFPSNIYQLEDAVELALSIGCKEVQIGIVCSVGRAENKNWDLSKEERLRVGEKVNELKDKYGHIKIGWEEENLERREHKCGAGFTRWEITSNGDIYPCATIRISIGNVVQDNLIDICKSPTVKFLQELLTPHEAMCGDCQYLYLCEGCHGQALSHSFKVRKCGWLEQFEKAPLSLKEAIQENSRNSEAKINLRN